MDRSKDIQKAYKQLGGSYANFYDGMITRTTPPGKLISRLVWGFNKETNAQWLNNALSGVPVGFSGKLLEIPVGTGVLTMPMYKELPEADITCMDYSQDMLDNAIRRAEAMDVRNVSFRQGDVGNLPFEDESFDIVLSLNGFHAFPDKEAAWKETFRVLRKGGTFCGCFYVKGGNRRTDWIIENFYTKWGFFTPPFETTASLRKRLKSMYKNVKVAHRQGIGVFRCRKE